MPHIADLPPPRPALRQRLLAQRAEFAASPQAGLAHSTLESHLADVIQELEPRCLGVYWPVRREFNPCKLWLELGGRNTLPLALPFVRKSPPRMEYRVWDGNAHTQRDEAGIPSPQGAVATPDVVLVPCLGFTEEGYRLGYGGGYFDRWLAAHPHVTSVGVAWEVGRIELDVFEPQAHDVPLTLIVTERGVV